MIPEAPVGEGALISGHELGKRKRTYCFMDWLRSLTKKRRTLNYELLLSSRLFFLEQYSSLISRAPLDVV